MEIEKTALVTGATRGIGRAISESLAASGMKVVGLARGADATFPGDLIEADVADTPLVEEMVRRLVEDSRVDVLVNNVGVGSDEAVSEISSETLRRTMDLNLGVACQTARLCLPSMMSRRSGRVVNISSVVARGARNRTSYASSKAALEAATRCWALEAAPFEVTVNCVAPGPVETELFRSLNPTGSPGEGIYLDGIPLGRLGRPADVAALVAFLVGDSAGFITGQTLYVDGGWSVRP